MPKLHKSIHDLNLEDDFLFAKVMSSKEICRKVLEQILNVPIREITTKIFLNTRGTMADVDDEMLEFLSYIENTTDLFAAQASNPLIQEIQKRVNEVKQNKEMEVEYMTLFQRDRENIAIGREEGLIEGRKEKNRMTELMKILLAQNQTDEMERALNDSEYMEELFLKYNL